MTLLDTTQLKAIVYDYFISFEQYKSFDDYMSYFNITEDNEIEAKELFFKLIHATAHCLPRP